MKYPSPYPIIELYIPDVEEANQIIDELRARNADLERVVEAISQNCTLRLDGSCDLECPGRILCNVQHLVPIQEGPP